jgi:hypothetical protein
MFAEGRDKMRHNHGELVALLAVLALLGCDGGTVSATGDAAGDDVRSQPEADPPEVPDAAPPDLPAMDAPPDRPAMDAAPDRSAMDAAPDAEASVDVADASAMDAAPDVAPTCPDLGDAGAPLGRFVRLGPSLGTPWLYMGMIGLNAGNEACRMMGAHHVCTFEELRAAEGRGDLSMLPEGTTFWANRLTCAVIAGVVYPAGETTCAGYTYMSGDTYDAEYARVMGGRVTWFLDTDPTPFRRNAGTGSCRAEYAVPCCAAP